MFIFDMIRKQKFENEQKLIMFDQISRNAATCVKKKEPSVPAWARNELSERKNMEKMEKFIWFIGFVFLLCLFRKSCPKWFFSPFWKSGLIWKFNFCIALLEKNHCSQFHKSGQTSKFIVVPSVFVFYFSSDNLVKWCQMWKVHFAKYQIQNNHVPKW